jgi:hypothetical protein
MIVDKTMFMRLLLALLGLFILLFSIALFRYSKPVEDLTVKNEEQENVLLETEKYIPGTAQVPDSLVLLYETEVKNTDFKGRGWPTMHIWIKKGNNNPVFVAEVGKVGEYPYNYALSHSRKYLAVNLEKAVDLIDLQSKKKKRIFTTDKSIIGVVFSQDDTKLLVSDGAVFSPSDVDIKDIHSINLANGEDTVLITDLFKSIKDLSGLGGDVQPRVWRKDGILLYEPLTYKDGCGGSYRMLDLAKKLATSTYGGRFNESGTRAFGEDIESVPNTDARDLEDICSSYYLTTIVSIVDPISGETYGRVGKSGEIFSYSLAFSPDNSKVLFSTFDKSTRTNTYYLQDVDFNSIPVEITDPLTLLASWKAQIGIFDLIDAGNIADSEDSNTVYYKGEKFFTLDHEPLFLGQYFE